MRSGDRFFVLVLVSFAVFLIATTGQCGPIDETTDENGWTDEEWLKDERLMINYEVKGNDGRKLELKFPYFTQTIRSLDEKFMKVVKEHTKQAIDEISKTMVTRLNAGAEYFAYYRAFSDWAKLAVELTKIAFSKRKNLKNLDTKVGTGGKFNKEMGDFFIDLAAQAEAEASKLRGAEVQISKAEFREELKFLLTNLSEAISTSPVGPYVRWTKGSVNGENFGLYAAKLMGKANVLGVGGLLGPLQNLFALLKTTG